MRDNRAIAGVAVAALGLSLAYGAAEAAGDGTDTTAGQAASALSKAETRAVRKIATTIAKKQAAQQIKRAAPTLRVGSAARADLADLATTATTAQQAQSALHATTADMATNAQNAVHAAKVGGLDVKKINTLIAPDAATVKVIDTAGFTLTASCATGAVDLVAASTVPGGRLRSADIDNNEVVSTQGSNDLSEAGFSIHGPGGDGRGSLTLEFVSASGVIVNAWIGYRNDAPGCVYFGNYMVG